MKKQILFICSNMGVGGFQKSLISLLQCFDYDKYDVDLLLLNPSGIFMGLIPNEVHQLPVIIDPEYFSSAKKAMFSLFKKRLFWYAINRCISAFLWIFNKGVGASFMVNCLPRLSKHYDVAIDYNGQQVLYYMVKKVEADKKITFFHSDYKKWGFYKKTDRKYYKYVDSIVTVSDDCVMSMKEVFPEYSQNIFCIENIISEKTVNIFPINSNPFNDEFDGIRLLTIGRVCRDKGFDFACEALRKLIDDGYKIRWYFVGPNTEPKYIESFIQKFNLSDDLVLLGATNNPYDFIRQSDVVVQPSRFEGKSVAIEEAKILRKPIIATNFSTIHDQIIDRHSGLIVDMNGEAVYEGIKTLIDDNKLMSHIVDYQSNYCFGNENEKFKLYKLIGD